MKLVFDTRLQLKEKEIQFVYRYNEIVSAIVKSEIHIRKRDHINNNLRSLSSSTCSARGNLFSSALASSTEHSVVGISLYSHANKLSKSGFLLTYLLP